MGNSPIGVSMCSRRTENTDVGPRYKESLFSVISDLAPNRCASLQESLLDEVCSIPFTANQAIGGLKNYQLGIKS